MKIETVEQLLQHELKDLYSAETQLTKAMPKMAKKASSEELRKSFETHLKETEEQVVRLQQIAEEMGAKLTGHTCKAMKGLIEEASETMSEDATPEILDAALIAQAQRIEHYEIAGYGTARALAQQCGLSKVAKMLEKTLQEEKKTDELLSKLAYAEVNEQAAAAK
jgi:ferritin-like metal-binding protein YciE